MPPPDEGHKWFAAYWDRMVKLESTALKRARAEALQGLSGRVLEVGAGNGANFPLYPAAVTEIVATEPDPHMLKRARIRATQLARAIELHQATAEDLPFPDASFDAAVSILVLCSVTDQARALAEINRVLKPGAQLRYIEHVRFDNACGGLFQDLVTPAWRWLGAGCHPNRRTAMAITSAGFTIQSSSPFNLAPPIPPFCVTRPAILGTAVKP